MAILLNHPVQLNVKSREKMVCWVKKSHSSNWNGGFVKMKIALRPWKSLVLKRGQNGSHFEPRVLPPTRVGIFKLGNNWEGVVEFSNSATIGKGSFGEILKAIGRELRLQSSPYFHLFHMINWLCENNLQT